MIKANELRIGNLINARHHNNTAPNGGGFFLQPIEIQSIIGYMNTITTIHGENIDIEENRLSPIPLTEEWLEKFGLDKNNAWDAFEFSNGLIKYVGGPAISTGRKIYGYAIIESIDGWPELFFVSENLCFVHQLQNLYFALTGEELTIKEVAK